MLNKKPLKLLKFDCTFSVKYWGWDFLLAGVPSSNKYASRSAGRNDMDEGWKLKESHTYEKRPTKMQQASHNQTTNKILSHFYQLFPTLVDRRSRHYMTVLP